jgi:hypothetical protein
MSNNFVMYDMVLTQIIQQYNLNLPDAIVGTIPANSFVVYDLPIIASVNALQINPNTLGIPVEY